MVKTDASLDPHCAYVQVEWGQKGEVLKRANQIVFSHFTIPFYMDYFFFFFFTDYFLVLSKEFRLWRKWES